jgi:hypothetical protein
VILGGHGEHGIEVAVTEYKQVAEQFPTERVHPTLSEGVGPRRGSARRSLGLLGL